MTDVTTAPNEVEQELQLVRLIIARLNLELSPADIDPDAALFDEGLGLDSIDILEVALAVSQEYGVRLRSDDKDNEKIFRSLRSLNRHIQKLRTK